jgi:two-component system response regulator LytT
MKIVIVEDEILTAEDLKDVILQVEPQAEIVATLHSIKEAMQYFKTHELPQLIVSDIQLGDGLSFEIYTALDIKVPIIFCTAYDEYAIKAFNANGIHYVLKPFNTTKIKEAFDKFHQLRHTFTNWAQSIEDVLSALQHSQATHKKVTSLLVHYQNKVIPFKLSEIAIFFIKNDATLLYTFDQQSYVVNKTLDELQQLDPDLFFRANRQFIVNRNAIKEASHYLARKMSLELTLPFEGTITISKEKVSQFFEWLSGSSEP